MRSLQALSAQHPRLLAQVRGLLSSRWVRLAFLALSLGFMAAVMRTYWQDVVAFSPTLHPLWLALSFAGLLPALLLEAVLWRSLLGALGHRLPLRRSAGLWFLSSLARYIPGNVWQFLGMMELGAASGVPRATTITSVALHQVFCNGAGLLVGAPLLATALELSTVTKLMAAAVVAAALALALSPPGTRYLNRFLTRVTRTPGSPPLPAPRLALTLAGYCAYWLWVGLAFWALGRGMGASEGSPLAWASAFSASYVAGYLSLLTPSGLGVREGVLALLLAGVAGPGAAAVAALVARLWLSVAEIVAAIGAALADPRLVWGRAKRSET